MKFKNRMSNLVGTMFGGGANTAQTNEAPGPSEDAPNAGFESILNS